MRKARKITGVRRVRNAEPIVVRDPGEMQALANKIRRQGMSIGFVPTMGYLHEGHASLIRAAREESDVVVLSIFVNPTQFGPTEDLDKYPRDMERDTRVARDAGVDYIFYPEPRAMYPDGFQTYVTVERLTKGYCGVSRPTHFRGVTTICTKLFNIVLPHKAYFGQKDFQQAAVIRRMVKDLDMNLEVVVLPTIRESDGLAMSSRNAYLSPSERAEAVCLIESIRLAREMVRNGERDVKTLTAAMRAHIESKPSARVDYVSIADADSLEELETITAKGVILLAVYIGKTRLIDNEILVV
ncbi:MAG: pantoate--beta-alanine ligase [Candidatus Abyssubacteria bacterium]